MQTTTLKSNGKRALATGWRMVRALMVPLILLLILGVLTDAAFSQFNELERLGVSLPKPVLLQYGKYISLLMILAVFVLVSAQTLMEINQSVRAEARANWLMYQTRQVKHDVASPLSALRIASQFPNLSPELREFLESAVSRATEIVNDLGKLGQERVSEVISLGEVCEKVINEKSSRRISLNYSDVSVKACRTSLTRAISNILNNALEADPLGHIDVYVWEDEAGAHLRIEDDGPGFPAKILSGVEHGLSVNKPGGSGLGLAHAAETLSRCGGELHLFNEGGAVVLMDFPSVGRQQGQSDIPVSLLG